MAEDKTDKKLKKEFDEIEPFLGDAPIVTIKGREYKMKRLGITEIFKLGRILAVGAAGMGKEVGKIDLMDPSVLAGLLLVSFPYAENQCMEFIANIINVKVEELKNPELFPIDSVLDIIEVLMEHEDIKTFFIKLTKLLRTPIFKGFSKKG